MRRPYVQGLSYDFVSLVAHDDFSQARPWRGRLGVFESVLADGSLSAVPLQRFADVASARQAIEPLLKAWEADAELRLNQRIEFRYASASLVEPPSQQGANTVSLEATVMARASVSAEMQVLRGSYPPAPSDRQGESEFALRCRERLRDIRDGRERLLSGVYWFATALSDRYGRAAPASLKVSANLLDELKRIASIDDPVESRKAGGGPKRPLTDRERQIATTGTALLAVRVAEVEGGADLASLDLLTVQDIVA